MLKRNPRNENFHAQEGFHHILSDFFCQTVPKNFLVGTLVFQKSSGSEN